MDTNRDNTTTQASATSLLARRARAVAARDAATPHPPAPATDPQPAAAPPARHPRRPRRRSVRLATTLLALGAASATIFAGSYAAWTAQTNNPGSSVAAGTLTMTNSKSAASVFAATNVKPGDTGSSTVTVTNTGSLPMTVRITQDQLTSTGIEASLRLSIHDDTKDYCYWPTQGAGACASLGAWDGSATLTSYDVAGTGAAQWAASEAHTFTASWELISSSPNSDQGKTGSFRLVWDGLQ